MTSNTTYVNNNGELTATDCEGGATMLGYVVGPVVSLLLSSYGTHHMQSICRMSDITNN